VKHINPGLLVILLLCFLLPGCESGGSSTAGSSSRAGSADLTLRVDFGSLNQVLAQTDGVVSSIRIEIRSAATGQPVTETRVLSRPATGTVAATTFINIPLGQLVVSADFLNAAGEVLGRDSEVVNLVAGSPVTIFLSFLEAVTPDEPDTPVTTTREFVVAANVEQLLVFELVPDTGALTQQFVQDFGDNSLPFSVDIRSDGFVYVTFTFLSQIQQFQLNPSNGSLTPLTALARPLPEGGALSPDGRFFFHCQPLLTDPGAVRVYSLDPTTGTPTEIPNSPFIIPGANQPQRIFVHPNGRFLYVAERISPLTSGVFYAFEIDGTTGDLTQIGGAVTITSPRAFAFALSPDQSTLYVSGNSSIIDGFTIDPTDGTLTLVSPPYPAAVDPQLGEMVVDPVADILYVCGTTQGQIEAFNLDGTGRPTTQLSGSPYSLGSNGTLTLKRSPSGGYLIATSTGDGAGEGNISVLRIEPDSTLTLVPSSPVPAGTGTFDLDVVQLTF